MARLQLEMQYLRAAVGCPIDAYGSKVRAIFCQE
jgi:hypothetical protein